ncbi:MAG: hypothetical protein IPP47_27845 [Bryobacterales bacterium]|nr:hypothetical protein [Bryobacterales bacterium]
MSSIINNMNPVAQMSVSLLGGPQGAVVGQALAPFAGKAGMQQLQQVFKQLQQALGDLQKLLGGQGGQASQAGSGGFQAQPGAMSPASINIEIRMNPSATLAQGDMSFGKAPIVGNDSQWPAFSQSVNSRITGSDSAKAGLFDGSNPWSKNDGKTGERAAIGWTMQQNDKLRYDADSKQFYTTGADGARTNAVSLDQVMQTINGAGGAGPSNGAAFQAVGNLVNNLPNAQQPPPDMTQILKMFEDLIQMMQGGGAGGGSTQAATGGSGAGSASGAGWSSPATGASAAGGALSSSSTGNSGSASGAGGGVSSSSSGGWGNIDSMMSQAESLMNSDKPSDQLKAQQLMQKAQRMFEMISKMMEQRSQMMSKAIQAIK